MVLIVVFCASFFVPARTLIGVKLLSDFSVDCKRDFLDLNLSYLLKSGDDI